ncbi:wax ester/triacylglycerol synthase family O-acyltransferase [Marinobacter sp. F4216]|uniref:wax ester/triacylglycerol synthase family O-acyltransferase n=1 Tax=Marinobacter sp. F4216 TaxID=2874281 RepID=UPI001CBB074A|nr:wax ester/triacylglycerol synthase family O-acyltransferase [Marinobacter sp. F4216]MBZ2168366.1 wax ester/triacylglycerol synthase family O-acyltransferase [Marinobacter sp. F4216]
MTNHTKMTPTDAAFVQLENPNAPMHVAGLMIFELPPKASPDFVSKLVADWKKETRIESPWNQKLVSPSRWQLAPRLKTCHDPDLEYHVRHLFLPKPGGQRELGQLVARLHSQPMDLRKLLWECVIIEGLADNKFAIYMKFHHAIVDGISANILLMNGLSDAMNDKTTAPFWIHPAPEKPFQMGPFCVPTTQAMLRTARNVFRLFSRDESLTTFRSAPWTPLNGPIGAQRRFATQSFEMHRMKAVAKTAGVSLNDVVLCLVGGTLRQYLQGITALPGSSLTAAIPMSLREKGDQSFGNSVGMIYSILGTNIADPLVRLQKIHDSTDVAKQQVLGLPQEMRTPYSLVSMLPSVIRMVAGVSGNTSPMFNAVVSNVPGGTKEKYLRGARLVNCYPANIVFPGMAVSFTFYSHAGTLNLGITACRDTVPRMQKLATDMQEALRELEQRLGLSDPGKPAEDGNNIPEAV